MSEIVRTCMKSTDWEQYKNKTWGRGIQRVPYPWEGQDRFLTIATDVSGTE